MDWLTKLKQQRVIAVIRSTEMSIGLKMAHAVATGGMRWLEITWNSDRPRELISQLRSELPHCQIGTGTLLNIEQLNLAIASGSQFLFTPHVDSSMIKIALERGIPIIPGTLSPTEIVTAWNAGATAVKVFPVSAVGGVNYIRSLAPVLGHIPLIPTGGVTQKNAQEFIRSGAIAVGLAGDLFPHKLIIQQDWDAITALARHLLQNLATN